MALQLVQQCCELIVRNMTGNDPEDLSLNNAGNFN